MRTIFKATIAVGLVCCSLTAQQTSVRDSLLDRMVGTWVLQGTIAGKETTHDVVMEWVLDHEYVQMHEVSRERTPAGTPAYEAIVYFVRDPSTKQYAVLWLDNTAAAVFDPGGVGHATAAGDSIPFVFVYSDTSRFHNTLVYHRPADTWEWHMDNEQSGVRRPFARVTLKRKH